MTPNDSLPEELSPSTLGEVDLEYTHTFSCPTCSRRVAAGLKCSHGRQPGDGRRQAVSLEKLWEKFNQVRPPTECEARLLGCGGRK